MKAGHGEDANRIIERWQPHSSGGLSRTESSVMQLPLAHEGHKTKTYRARALSDGFVHVGSTNASFFLGHCSKLSTYKRCQSNTFFQQSLLCQSRLSALLPGTQTLHLRNTLIILGLSVSNTWTPLIHHQTQRQDGSEHYTFIPKVSKDTRTRNGVNQSSDDCSPDGACETPNRSDGENG